MDNEELQEQTTEEALGIGLYGVIIFPSVVKTLITPIVERCELKIDVDRIVSYSRDGTIYIQAVSPRKRTYSVVCYGTKTQTETVENEFYYGSLICIILSGGESEYYGRILEFNKERMFEENNIAFDGTSWEEYYKMELKLAYEDAPSSTATTEETSEENSEET